MTRDAPDAARPWQDALGAGRVAFNRGAFFEAHEHWEEAWHALTGDDRTFVQGLIQIAAGLHHLQQGRLRPADRLLHKGLAKLALGAATPSDRFGLRAEALAGALTRVLAASGGPGAVALDRAGLAL